MQAERAVEYMSDLTNLVKEMRMFADSHQRMLDSGLYQEESAEYHKLAGSILARRNDATELECWLNAVKRIDA